MMLKHTTLIGSAVLLAMAGSAGVARGQDETPVAAAFGNTLQSTYPDGRTAELWLQADGGYAAEGRRQDPSSGHWHVKGDKLCLKQNHPFAVPFDYCVPLPPAGMDQGWSGKAYTGEAVTIRLIAGHVTGGG